MTAEPPAGPNVKACPALVVASFIMYQLGFASHVSAVEPASVPVKLRTALLC